MSHANALRAALSSVPEGVFHANRFEEAIDSCCSAEETFMQLLDSGASTKDAINAVHSLQYSARHCRATAEEQSAEETVIANRIFIAHRTALCERLRRYAKGQVPAVSLSADLQFPALYAERPWSESSHRFCPPQMREVILMLLLASRRLIVGDALFLPPELWVACFRFMNRDWIDSVGLREARRKREERERIEEWQRMRESLCLLNPAPLEDLVEFAGHARGVAYEQDRTSSGRATRVPVIEVDTSSDGSVSDWEDATGLLRAGVVAVDLSASGDRGR
jgi:hypothetical protein